MDGVVVWFARSTDRLQTRLVEQHSAPVRMLDDLRRLDIGYRWQRPEDPVEFLPTNSVGLCRTTRRGARPAWRSM
jgi:hypothetical protein